MENFLGSFSKSREVSLKSSKLSVQTQAGLNPHHLSRQKKRLSKIPEA